MSIRSLVDDCFFIAWNFLERSGELGAPEASANILLDSIEQQLRTGERRPLMLANRAIAAHQQQAAMGRLVPRRGEVRWMA